MSSLTLFADRGCPYAHRVLALLAAIGADVDLRATPLGTKPIGVWDHSATGQIPLLVDGDLVLTESQVMLEYLAEKFDYVEGLPPSVEGRAEHRRGMALIDRFLAPRLIDPDVRDGARFDEVLDALDRIVAAAGPETLLAFHAAPIWLHLQERRVAVEVMRRIRSRDRLLGWLDRAVATDSMRQTTPDFAVVAKDVEAYLRRA